MTPVAPLTLQLVVCQFCAPPVAGTSHVARTVPVGLPLLTSIAPCADELATRAENVFAPAPKSTPRTLTQSPSAIDVTSMPPSEQASVSMPLCAFMVSASTRTYGLSD